MPLTKHLKRHHSDLTLPPQSSLYQVSPFFRSRLWLMLTFSPHCRPTPKQASLIRMFPRHSDCSQSCKLTCSRSRLLFPPLSAPLSGWSRVRLLRQCRMLMRQGSARRRSSGNPVDLFSRGSGLRVVSSPNSNRTRQWRQGLPSSHFMPPKQPNLLLEQLSRKDLKLICQLWRHLALVTIRWPSSSMARAA